MRKLLLATNNQGKIREYKSLLKDVPLELVTMDEQGITSVVDESGSSMEENAGLKAVALAAESRLFTLADDSGLEVDALNGEPGIRSARYAGDNASDSEKVKYLLSLLEDVPRDKRTALFRCVIALAEPGKETEYFTGICRGMIAFEPAGEKGFGYDPVFYIPEENRTMAELEPDVKNRISHRARAAEKVRKALISRYGNSPE